MSGVAETARLRLRPFTVADADSLAALHGDPRVMRFLGDGRPEPRRVVETATLPALLSEYRTLPPGHGCFAAEERGAGFVGWFSLRPAASAGLTGGTEIGYRLLPAAWGRGLATEGARALVRMAFAELGAERVVATTMTVNHGSRRVLEKAGLKHVRTFFLAWPEYLPGAEQGDVEYALSRPVRESGGASPLSTR
ncbi:GNAT family N-acetyltransferase [Amycolatopsis ultiminotia]|uniref:GNAT family N-acetyltransferase n=1 Tax=Amycolatopsis ultiminotia TaxID=543629 RepID=A0ABP6YMF9_9PSEU